MGYFLWADECAECPPQGVMIFFAILLYLFAVSFILYLANSSSSDAYTELNTVATLAITHFQVMGVILFTLGPILDIPEVAINLGLSLDVVFSFSFIKVIAAPECIQTGDPSIYVRWLPLWPFVTPPSLFQIYPSRTVTEAPSGPSCT